MPRFRPRISILNAMLLMTIIAMAIVIVQFWRKIGPLQAENKRLNEERGTLVIDDPTKVHAIKIPARFAGEDRTSFRVYVPPGQRYMAFVQVNNIPKVDFPERKPLPGHAGILGNFQGRLFARLDPGDHVVTVRTVRRGRIADISLIASLTDPHTTLDASATTSKEVWPTVVPEAYSVYGDGVESRTVSVDQTERLVLMRYRIQAVSPELQRATYSIPEPGTQLDGVMLWVEPAK